MSIKGKVFWIILIFVVVAGYMIKLNMDLNLDDRSDQGTLLKELGKWFVKVGKNTADTVGYAAEHDWVPDKPEELNSTGVE